MIFYIVGACLYGAFDFLEISELENNRAKIWERILFTMMFAVALGLGIYYLSSQENPNLTRGLIDYFNLRGINY